jgi:hypothetical protein
LVIFTVAPRPRAIKTKTAYVHNVWFVAEVDAPLVAEDDAPSVAEGELMFRTK